MQLGIFHRGAMQIEVVTNQSPGIFVLRRISFQDDNSLDSSANSGQNSELRFFGQFFGKFGTDGSQLQIGVCNAIRQVACRRPQNVAPLCAGPLQIAVGEQRIKKTMRATFGNPKCLTDFQRVNPA